MRDPQGVHRALELVAEEGVPDLWVRHSLAKGGQVGFGEVVPALMPACRQAVTGTQLVRGLRSKYCVACDPLQTHRLQHARPYSGDNQYSTPPKSWKNPLSVL